MITNSKSNYYEKNHYQSPEMEIVELCAEGFFCSSSLELNFEDWTEEDM